jgi:very-short-patch-repair endonuclease
VAASWRALLDGQRGLITADQAGTGGLSRQQVDWRVASGRWQRVHPRVYAAQSGELTTEQREFAALLYAGPGAVLSHNTAARRDGLRGHETTVVHVTVPAERRVRSVPGVHVHRSRLLGRVDVHPTREPPRTRLARSIVDIAIGSRGRDDVRAVLAAGVQQRLVLPADLRVTVLRAGPCRHRALILTTLADITGGSHSLPELQMLALLRRARLAEPDRRQKQLRAGRYYLDMWWEAPRLAVEVDGGLHRMAEPWWDDLDRMNEICLDDRLVLRFPSHAIRERPDRVADQVRRGLARQPARRSRIVETDS